MCQALAKPGQIELSLRKTLNERIWRKMQTGTGTHALNALLLPRFIHSSIRTQARARPAVAECLGRDVEVFCLNGLGLGFHEHGACLKAEVSIPEGFPARSKHVLHRGERLL